MSIKLGTVDLSYGDLSGYVKTTGNETIAGVKTFSSSPIVPTPTTDYHPATKKYVDDNAGGGTSQINLQYPHDISSGFSNVMQRVGTSESYTVPSGKVLYLNSIDGIVLITIGGLAYMLPGHNQSNDYYLNITIPTIISSGVVIQSEANYGYISGFICDENINITPIYTSSSYTVPSGKKFILNGIFNLNGSFTYANIGAGNIVIPNSAYSNAPQLDISMNTLHQPMLFKAGDVVNSTSATANLFGYLVPDTFIV